MRLAAHIGRRRARGRAAAAALALLGAACTHDWDSLDPRGGASNGAGVGGAGGGDSSAGSGAGGGSGAAGGGSGTGGAAGASGSAGAGAAGGGGEGATSADASDAGGAGGATDAGGAGGVGGATDAAGDVADSSAGAAGTDATAGAGGTADGAAGSAGSDASAGSGGAADGGGAGGAAGAGGTAGASGTAGTGGGPLDVEYGAAVADCVNPTAPNPDTCETITGLGEMSVDLLDGTTGTPHYSFLRFALDATFAGKTVLAVKLRLHTTLDGTAGTNLGGEVWSVSPFTRTDLFSTVPTQISMLAASFGPVLGDAIVEWTLPTNTAQPSTPVYLGVFPTSTDGANYWNNNGAFPPRLVVTYQ